MATYRDLKAQAEKLLAQAEEARLAELHEVVQQVRGLVDEYGLTPEQVFGRKRAKPNGNTPRVTAPKYQNPKTGQTCSGRGREPLWIKGKNRDRFLIPD
ncbi:H-NS histone family protein [Paraburkholderia tropica]|uniref:H-NS histone family protein n=1 Tax=Paraburkholderia tropica TaxID=92647 RepID=UPI002AB6380A|nr:H-NS histone family protein [Paraburkholderia tropica]